MRNAFIILLVVASLSAGLVLAQQTGGEMNYGDVVTGTISDDAPVHEWTFEGQAGDQISITLEAANPETESLDSYLILLDEDGKIVAENDDGAAGSSNAAITDLVLNRDGTYTIKATRFRMEDGSSTGDYELTLTLVSDDADQSSIQITTPTPTPIPTLAPPETRIIEYDLPVNGRLDSQNYETRWIFSGQEGDVITIRMGQMEDSHLDSYVILADQDGEELASNDDIAQGNPDAEITAFMLPYSGQYMIIATRYGQGNGSSEGRYTLEIESGVRPVVSSTLPPVATPDPSQATPTATLDPNTTLIQYGDTVEGQLEAGEFEDIYVFDGQTGDEVTISVKRRGGEFDPSLALRDSRSVVLAQNASFNGPADARIEKFVLPVSGRYRITVTGDNNSRGDYVLTLFQGVVVVISPTPTLTPTPVTLIESTLDLSDAVLAITLSWEGAADFDLSVSDSTGATIDFANPESRFGGLYSGDVNGGCTEQYADPAESVYWESQPPVGTYRINVAYIFPCGQRGIHPYTLTITYEGEVVRTVLGKLDEGGSASYEWTLEAVN